MAEQLTKSPLKQVYTTSLGAENDLVTIGDEKSSVFVPQIKFSKWQGENSLTIKAPDIFTSTTPTLANNKIEIGDSKTGFYFNPVDDTTIKFGIILKDKPLTNEWVLNLEGYEDLEFVRPASIVEKGVAKFPEQVGGYKVNSKDGTKKFGFFYQPIFIDAKGNKCPAKLLVRDGKYIVRVSQEFLDKAVYPVIANDTFQSDYPGGIRVITVNVAQNDLIVVGYSYNEATTDATISDEDANVYTEANKIGTAPGGIFRAAVGVQVWYAIAKNTNSTCTITCSYKVDPGISCHTYSGMNTADPYDNSLTYKDASEVTTHTTGNLAVSTSAGKLFAFWAQEDTARTNGGTDDWVIRTEEADHIHLTLDKPFAASGNYTASMTTTADEGYICVFVAFNTAEGGGVKGMMSPRTGFWGDI